MMKIGRMRAIIAIDGKDVRNFEFYHRGANTVFRCLMNPLPLNAPEYTEYDLNAPEYTEYEFPIRIEFSDLYEVDELIKMLERFRDENLGKYLSSHWDEQLILNAKG